MTAFGDPDAMEAHEEMMAQEWMDSRRTWIRPSAEVPSEPHQSGIL